MKRKMSQFLMAGIACIMATNALSATMPVEKFHERPAAVVSVGTKLGNLIKDFQNANMLPKDIVLKTSTIDYSSKQIDTSQMEITKDGCIVSITTGKNGEKLYAGTLDNYDKFADIMASENSKQNDLQLEYLTLHEASHCQFRTIDSPFIIKGNDALSQKISYIFNLASTTYKPSILDSKIGNSFESVYRMLDESFADTYALIHMMKKHGSDQDLQKVMIKIHAQRKELGIYHNNGDKFIAHDTHHAIGNLLKPEMLDKINSINSQAEIQQLALEIANDNIAQVLVNNNFQSGLDLTHVYGAVTDVFGVMVNSKYNSDGDISLISSAYNSDNSIAYKLADILFKDYDSDTYWREVFVSNPEEAQLKAYEDGSLRLQELLEDIGETVFSEQETTSTIQEYISYIKSNYEVNENLTTQRNANPDLVSQRLNNVRVDLLTSLNALKQADSVKPTVSFNFDKLNMYIESLENTKDSYKKNYYP